MPGARRRIAPACAFSASPHHGIDRYEARWRAIASSGEAVRIDGPCNSACTLLTGLVPRNLPGVRRRGRFNTPRAPGPRSAAIFGPRS
jgi:hypothetical protein